MSHLLSSLAMIVAVGCASPSDPASTLSQPPESAGSSGIPALEFPVLEAIRTCDPGVRHEEDFIVPIGYVLVRRGTQIAYCTAPGSGERCSVSVGKDMVTGFHTQVFLRLNDPAAPRSDEPICFGVRSGRNGQDAGTGYIYLGEGGVPLDARSFHLEIELDCFETDVPPQHGWMPWTRKYDVIWSRLFVLEIPDDKDGPR